MYSTDLQLLCCGGREGCCCPWRCVYMWWEGSGVLCEATLRPRAPSVANLYMKGLVCKAAPGWHTCIHAVMPLLLLNVYYNEIAVFTQVVNPFLLLLIL